MLILSSQSMLAPGEFPTYVDANSFFHTFYWKKHVFTFILNCFHFPVIFICSYLSHISFMFSPYSHFQCLPFKKGQKKLLYPKKIQRSTTYDRHTTNHNHRIAIIVHALTAINQKQQLFIALSKWTESVHFCLSICTIVQLSQSDTIGNFLKLLL